VRFKADELAEQITETLDAAQEVPT